VDRLLHAFIDHALDEVTLEKFSSQEISSFAWSLASLGVKTEATQRFMRALTSHLIAIVDDENNDENNGGDRLRSFSPQSLAMTLWTFAKLQDNISIDTASDNDNDNDNDSRVSELLSAWMPCILPRVQEGEIPLNYLTAIAWSLARLSRESRIRTIHTQHTQHTQQSSSLEGGDVSDVGGADRDTQMMMHVDQFFRTLPCSPAALASGEGKGERGGESGGEGGVSSLNAQELSNIAWSFATMRVRDNSVDAFLKNVAQQAAVKARQGRKGREGRERRDEEYTPQGLANLAWAYASLGKYAFI
jgi:hypothetical protein